MSASEIHDRVAAAFGPTAAAYAASAGHGNAAVLAELVELVDPAPTDRLLDLATGAGHVALAFAPKVAAATALDLTPSMLRQVEATAQARGLSNVVTVEARAEELPLPDGSFEIVTVRLAPHHFADVPRFVKEVHRVLLPGGKFLVVDTTVPEDDWLDEEINRIELLRDPSHVRNYRASEWTAFLEGAGFKVVSLRVGTHSGGHRMEVAEWMDRIGTPAENRPRVLEALGGAEPKLAEALEIRRGDGSITFTLPELTLLAVTSQ